MQPQPEHASNEAAGTVPLTPGPHHLTATPRPYGVRDRTIGRPATDNQGMEGVRFRDAARTCDRGMPLRPTVLHGYTSFRTAPCLNAVRGRCRQSEDQTRNGHVSNTNPPPATGSWRHSLKRGQRTTTSDRSGKVTRAAGGATGQRRAGGESFLHGVNDRSTSTIAAP